MCRAVIASPPVARRWLQVACPLRSWRLRGSGEVCPFGAPSPCAPTRRLHGTGTLPHGVISDANITPVSRLSVVAMSGSADLACPPARGELICWICGQAFFHGAFAGKRGKHALHLAPDMTHGNAKDA